MIMLTHSLGSIFHLSRYTGLDINNKTYNRYIIEINRPSLNCRKNHTTFNTVFFRTKTQAKLQNKNITAHWTVDLLFVQF